MAQDKEWFLSMIIKSVVGVLAVLLLVSTVALSQEYQTPFPQAANPALTNGTAEQSSSSSVSELPSSMAANQSSTSEKVSASVAISGSPFPQAANPSLGTGTSETTSASFEDRHDSGSPFPSAANPSRQ
jgi:hypothetical protein